MGTEATDTFDYVVVGAGTAGCVMAARLSESGRHRVLLLEAGGEDRSPWIRIPLGYGRHFDDPRVNWRYTSEPASETAGRAIAQPRGKVLGGSSSINGLVYIRGQHEDYDHWAALGNEGWSARDTLPFFRRCEDQQRGADPWHGAGGPLKVSDPAEPHPLCDAFIGAAEQAGYRRNPDFNGERQDGFGYVQLTARDGLRSSAATAYLHPARRRANLEVRTGVHATRVLLRGRRAAGIEYRCDGRLRQVQARREVIVCAGAFNSPQLLQLSGIGPGERLRALGIEVVADLPGVGANLQDHYNGRLVYECAHPWTLNSALANPLRGLGALLRYALLRKGLLAMGASYAAGFISTDPAVQRPDVQIGLALFSGDRAGRPLHRFAGFSVVARLLRPLSRGEVALRSADPMEAPLIRPGYLSDERDLPTLLAGMKAARRLMQQPAIAGLVVREHDPGPDCTDDTAMEHHLRRRGGISYHPVGTCAMGRGPEAVVDARLRVHGVEGLRVVDASIMPTLVSGNTNAPTFMIAEKGAAMVLEDGATG
ncbi:MAG: GMC family oxidoreductase [Pseudomonadota bacterium]